MARDRRLPRALSRTDSGVPRVALLLAAVVTLVAAVWAARRDDGMDHLVSVVDIGRADRVLPAARLGGRAGTRYAAWRAPPNWLSHVVVPALGAAVIVAVIWEATARRSWSGSVWLAVGLVVLAMQRGPGPVCGQPVAGAAGAGRALSVVAG